METQEIFFLVIYIIGIVIISGLAFYIDAERIANPYTDTGTKWTLVALFWPAILVFLPVVVAMVTFNWVGVNISKKVIQYKKRQQAKG